MREVFQFQPIYQERVWGGRRLETVLARSLPEGPPIGESWEIVDRPEAQSKVRGGRFGGATLRQMIELHSADFMGPKWDPKRNFPLLVKWLDCSERLSLQVHPPAAVAPSLKGEPKTENWYVAHSVPGASLFVGLKPGITRAAFAKAVENDTAGDLVNKVAVASGDSVLVHSGQVHAIDAGNLILEIQQNSDTTYRLYDWGRVGLDGKARTLHIEESLTSIIWDEEPPALVRAAPTSGTIAACDEFEIRRMVIGKGESIHFKAGEQPRILSVAAGGVTIVGANPAKSLVMGDNAILPWSAELEFTAPEPSIVLVTEGFA
ncbi:MAG TPA: type I phosphomannose isomerase catalytic subunit [Opitutaceae bacterium]|jgi:mannose-6-phosphate isomerase|nr:type I phosphomannose isomerase catalytic subunit [Opitutaceae bacterium]